jgi:hypothetical protein
MGADTGIQVASTTNYAGVGNSIAFKMDVFTRDGQTNLVCDTRTKDGALIVRIQSFYHDGLKIGKSIATPDVQDFVAEADSPYSVCFRLRSPHDTGFVYVSAKDGSIVDIFTCTNGIYYPAESHLITELSDGMKNAVEQARESAMKQARDSAK